MRNVFIAAVFALAVLAAPAHAALFEKKPELSAQEAAAANLPAVTIWVDASWGFRNQGAANNLTKAHSAFAARGYKVVSVEPYIENGDLQGFFVTYQKP
ncbi:hypothetical protein [Lysobacter terrae]